MIGQSDGILVRAFCYESLPGSPQCIHLFDSKLQMQKCYSQFQVADEIDHSFVYFNGKQALVRWKNKAGPVQLCGSGAFALAWLIMHQYKMDVLEILTEHLVIMGYSEGSSTSIILPCHAPRLVENCVENTLYADMAAGIYLLHLQDENLLQSDRWIETYLKQQALAGIHAFCAFVWDDESGRGVLRYFVPWHGRDEDYVTGSIHQYLTPLVNELYKKKEQIWTQLSASGGRIESACLNGQVRLSGRCSVE